MSSSDWWARKLGGQPSAPAAPTSAPNYPSGPAAPPYVPPVPPSSTPQVTKDNIAEVAGMWKGGQATKTETQRCPNCGGDHFFSMSNGVSAGGAGARLMTQNGMATTAPRCFDCGYTTAFGLQTGAQ